MLNNISIFACSKKLNQMLQKNISVQDMRSLVFKGDRAFCESCFSG